ECGGGTAICTAAPFARDALSVSGQPGVAVMALGAGVPVVPAAIRGTYEALAGRRFYMPRGRPLAVRFGQPLYFHSRRRASHAEREEITRRIMGHIEALLHAGRLAESRRGEAGVS